MSTIGVIRCGGDFSTLYLIDLHFYLDKHAYSGLTLHLNTTAFQTLPLVSIVLRWTSPVSSTAVGTPDRTSGCTYISV